VAEDRMDAGLGGIWLKVIGLIVLGGIAALLVFVLFTGIWARLSLLGAIALFTCVLLAIAWVGDRRAQRRYDDAVGG
jgi:hypothetical protein